MVKKNFLKSSLFILAIVAMIVALLPISNVKAATTQPSLSYSAHVQTYGWSAGTIFASQKLEKEAPEAFAGTSGESKRMEALEINFKAGDATLTYRAHVQGYGWMNWMTADDNSNKTNLVGTQGEGKRMEALQISVEDLEGYKVLYRAHVQGYGWQNWVDASNPEAFAGTTGESKRIEALEIALLPTSSIVYAHDTNGRHTLSYNGLRISTEDCTCGDWEYSGSASKLVSSKTCILCGNATTETTTLQAALNSSLEEDGVVNVKSLTLAQNDDVTVHDGNTLQVEGKLDANNGKITNDGKIIARMVTGTKITNTNSGTVTVKGRYVKDKTSPDYYNDTDITKILKDCIQNVSAITEIDIEANSVPQIIDSELTVDRDLTINMNGNKVTASTISGHTPMIKQTKGNMTIENAVITNTLTDCIKSIATNGSLTIKNCTMKAKDVAIQIGEDQGGASSNINDLKDFTVHVENTDLTVTDAGIGVFVKGNNATVELDNVNIIANNADAVCIATNNYSKGIKMYVTGGSFTSSKGIAAALSSIGEYTLAGATLTGANAVELEGGDLNVINGSKITATAANKNSVYTANTSQGTSDTGCGIQLILTNKFFNGEEKNTNITIQNSEVKSLHNHGILVLEDSGGKVQKDSTVTLTCYDGSVVSGARGENLVKLENQSKVTVEKIGLN